MADDHPLVRKGMRALLDKEPDIEVVGEAADGRDAVELCRRLRPDLVLMDLRMPEMSGIEATRAIKREFPRTIVLVLTGFEESNYLAEALKAGAGGYILKHAPSSQTLSAIRRALSGESPLDQQVAMELLTRLLEQMPGEEPASRASSEKQHPGPSLLETLTPRETEVLRLVTGGQTNRQIAKEMLISISAVKDYVGSIIKKLGVSDRTQAAVRAVELGLLSEQDEQ